MKSTRNSLVQLLVGETEKRRSLLVQELKEELRLELETCLEEGKHKRGKHSKSSTAKQLKSVSPVKKNVKVSVGSKTKGPVEGEKLYCICKKKYQRARPMIGCDVCQDWFHYTCLGISAASVKNLSKWYCPQCAKKSKSSMEVKNKRKSVEENTEVGEPKRPKLQKRKSVGPIRRQRRVVSKTATFQKTSNTKKSVAQYKPVGRLLGSNGRRAMKKPTYVKPVKRAKQVLVRTAQRKAAINANAKFRSGTQARKEPVKADEKPPVEHLSKDKEPDKTKSVLQKSSPTKSHKKASGPKSKNEHVPAKGAATKISPKAASNTVSKKEKTLESNSKVDAIQSSNSESDVHCLCGKKTTANRFMVACDLCFHWFHGSCVGISEKQAAKIDSWTCKECKKEHLTREKELYCVCKTPYDESKFYICCDLCQEWYHGACVGITEAESESLTEEYICGACIERKLHKTVAKRGKSLLDKTGYAKLQEIFNQVKDHKMAWPFLVPTNVKTFKGYSRVVKEPMDLSCIERKLNRKAYRRLQEFVTDMAKIWDNAYDYHGRDSAIGQCADVLDKLFTDSVKAFQNVKK